MTRALRVRHIHRGVPLVGLATATPRGLTVTLLEPFSRGPDVRHLPVFALPSVGPSGYLSEREELSSFGLRRAEGLLVELYEGTSAATLDEHHPVAPKEPLDAERFFALRRALRRDLRRGLDPRTYQRRYAALKLRRHGAR